MRFVRRSGAVLQQEAAHTLWLEGGALRGVTGASGNRYPAGKVLVACGGMSYPGTGSDGTGYRLAKQAGHTIVPLRPSPGAGGQRRRRLCGDAGAFPSATVPYRFMTGRQESRFIQFRGIAVYAFRAFRTSCFERGEPHPGNGARAVCFRIDLKPALSF